MVKLIGALGVTFFVTALAISSLAAVQVMLAGITATGLD
jgi:hypothetical protein